MKKRLWKKSVFVLVLLNTMHNVLKRSITVELLITIRHCVIILALAATYMFALQEGETCFLPKNAPKMHLRGEGYAALAMPKG